MEADVERWEADHHRDIMDYATEPAQYTLKGLVDFNKLRHEPSTLNCVLKAQGSSLVLGAVTPAEIRSGWRKMKVTVDSGAAESVIPPDETCDYPVKQHADDIYYGTASGEPLKNLGEVRLPMVTPSRRLRGMTFQACDVTKSVASVANMLDAGQAVIFAPEAYGGSCVVDLESGDEEQLLRQDGNLIMEVWVPPPKVAADVVRQP